MLRNWPKSSSFGQFLWIWPNESKAANETNPRNTNLPGNDQGTSWEPVKKVLSNEGNNFAAFYISFQDSVLNNLSEEFLKNPKFVHICIMLIFELAWWTIFFPFQEHFIEVIEQALSRHTDQDLSRLISVFFHLPKYDIVHFVKN